MGPDSILDQEICRLVDQYQTALLRMCDVGTVCVETNSQEGARDGQQTNRLKK
jgi:hypothetical protein